MAPTPSCRVTVINLRPPPDGAFDAAAAWLLRRNLDLVGSVAHGYEAGPSRGLAEGGAPQPWLFQAAGRTHVVVLSAWTTNGQDLVARGDLYAASGPVARVQGAATLSDPAPAIHELTTQLLGHMGAAASAEEAGRISAPAIPPGPAFGAYVRYVAALWGGPYDADGELRVAAEAGYGRAWSAMASWAETAEEMKGFQADPSDLLPTARRATQCDPFLASAHEQVASILAAAGRADEALAVVDAALAFAPSSADLLSRRAQVLRSLMRREEALASAEGAFALAPADAAAMRSLTAVLWELGQGDRATGIVEQMAARRPDDFDVQVAHGIELRYVKRYAEAVQKLERCMDWVGELPWYELGRYKASHLDYQDSARWYLCGPLAYAAAGAHDGERLRRYVQLMFDLSQEPATVAAAFGGVDGHVASIKAQVLAEARDGGAPTPPDGGVDLETYVRLQVETERAQAAGADVGAALARFGTDMGRWTKATTFWSEKISNDENVLTRYLQAKASYEASAPPPPVAAAAAPVAASPQPPLPADDHGGVATLEDWARVMGTIQKRMAAGVDFPTVLAELGLDMDRYAKAQGYWNARVTADPDLGMQLHQLMGRYM